MQNVYVPPARIPPIGGEDWDEAVEALFEWVGLASLGSQRYVLTLTSRVREASADGVWIVDHPGYKLQTNQIHTSQCTRLQTGRHEVT